MNPLTFRLSKNEDSELIQWLNSIPPKLRSETIRNALRSYLRQRDSSY